MKEHNNLWCEKSFDTVIPDRQGKCSRCGAILHELTVAEASRLVIVLEELALDRTNKSTGKRKIGYLMMRQWRLRLPKKQYFPKGDRGERRANTGC
jgi:hypothetical protein